MDEIIKYAKENRRLLHQVPEVGFTEYITTYLIYERLSQTNFNLYVGDDALDIDTQVGLPSDDVMANTYQRALDYGVPSSFLEKIHPYKTGVVATIDTNQKGPHVVLRFDIDALPIKESNEIEHVPFKEGFQSKHDGEMHACGHDAHAAIGISVATYIDEHIDELTGKYTIIFQNSEEGVRGAASYAKKGWLDDADYFLSGHVGTISEEVGTVGATATNFLASTKFNVELFGQSSHAGSNPQDGNNALLAASAIALSLNTIAPHREGATRLNVGTLQAGQGRNIIPDYAKLECESRGETTHLNEYMFERAKEIIENGAKMYGCKSKITVEGFAPSATCSKEMIDVVKSATVNNDAVKTIVDEVSMDASEDAAVFINIVQENNGKATYLIFPYHLKYGHHHPSFDVDEAVLEVAITTFINILNELK